METRKLIAAWLKWKTQQDGKPYTQQQLAADSGLSKSHISKIMNESGRKKGIVRTATLLKLAKAFGVTISELEMGPPLGQIEVPLRIQNKELLQFPMNDFIRMIHAISMKEDLDTIYNVTKAFHYKYIH